jgi:hypothetical protein
MMAKSASEYASDEFGCHYEVFFRLEHFKDRAPEGFQSPGKHDKGGPEGDLSVGDSQVLVHKGGHHRDCDERQAFGEENGGDPAGRIDGSCLF